MDGLKEEAVGARREVLQGRRRIRTRRQPVCFDRRPIQALPNHQTIRARPPVRVAHPSPSLMMSLPFIKIQQDFISLNLG